MNVSQSLAWDNKDHRTENENIDTSVILRWIRRPAWPSCGAQLCDHSITVLSPSAIGGVMMTYQVGKVEPC